VAVECVPAWNTDGIVTDGEIAIFFGETTVPVSLCRPQEIYITFIVPRFYLWMSGEGCKTA